MCPHFILIPLLSEKILEILDVTVKSHLAFKIKTTTTAKGPKESFGGDGHAYYFMVTWVYTRVQIHQIVYVNCEQYFVYALYLRKAGKTFKNQNVYI